MPMLQLTRMYLIVNVRAKIFWTVVLYSEKLGLIISTPESRFSDLVCILMELSLAVICGLSS